MKKFLLITMSLFLVSSLAFTAEEKSKDGKSETTSESASSPAGTISKGDSFMAAFGMQESSTAGGESGGSRVSAGATAVATTVVSTVSASLTSSQNTPYNYK